jgi:hypothetical protein
MVRLPKALGMLVVAGAGVSTFYVGAHWTRGQRDAHNDIVEAVVRPAPRAAAPSSAAAAASAAEADLPVAPADRSRAIPKSSSELFARSSWLPPPPPPPPPPPAPKAPAPPPPPAPVAPPVPFTFVGMLERGAAKPEAFLAKGNALLIVSAGDTLDNNTYRVESLTANEVVMTYLPLNTRQTINATTGSK